MRSRVRGDEVLQDGDGRQDLLELADRRLDGGEGGPAGSARRQYRRGHAPVALAERVDGAGGGLGPAGYRVIGGVEQHVGDAGQRRGHDHQRSAVGGDAPRRGGDGGGVGRATRRRTSRRAGERTAAGPGGTGA